MKAHDAMALVQSMASAPGNPTTSAEDLRHVAPFISMFAAGLGGPSGTMAGFGPLLDGFNMDRGHGASDAGSRLQSEVQKSADLNPDSGLSAARSASDALASHAPGTPLAEPQHHDLAAALLQSQQSADAKSLSHRLNPVLLAEQASKSSLPAPRPEGLMHMALSHLSTAHQATPSLSENPDTPITRTCNPLMPVSSIPEPNAADAEVCQPSAVSMIREPESSGTQQEHLGASMSLMHENLSFNDLLEQPSPADRSHSLTNQSERLSSSLGRQEIPIAIDHTMQPLAQQHLQIHHQCASPAPSMEEPFTAGPTPQAGTPEGDEADERFLNVLTVTMDAWEAAITKRLTSALSAAVKAARADVLQVCCQPDYLSS
jgi:hypothetical protein